MNEHLWWYIARASGLVAWVLLTASMLWGFLTATKILGKRPRPAWVLDLHRFLGGLAVVFVGVHLLGLLLDSFVEFTWADLLVPFMASYRPLALAWGITAFYLLLAVEITSLLKKYLALRTWRYIHWCSYAVFAFATVHSFTAGTDTRNLAVLVLLAVGVAEVAFLLLVRLTVRDTGAITPFASGARETSAPDPGRPFGPAALDPTARRPQAPPTTGPPMSPPPAAPVASAPSSTVSTTPPSATAGPGERPWRT